MKESKFEWDWFWSSCSFVYSTLCVNADKYTQEQAIEIFKSETEKMTTKEYIQWAKTLKAGDTISVKRFNGTRATATVIKITDNGDILTDAGRFIYRKHLNIYRAYGTLSFMLPAEENTCLKDDTHNEALQPPSC